MNTIQQLWLQKICIKNSYLITDLQLNLISNYTSELLAWNQKVNLISRKDELNIWEKHIVGSIAFLFKFSFESSTTLLDVGTGGGLPGIPIAILNPQVNCILVDSTQKKIKAVEDIIAKLKTDNVTTICVRAEELSRKHQHSFDYIISRAVAPINNIVKWTKPFLKTQTQQRVNEKPRQDRRAVIPKGSIIMLKGGNLEQEINEAKIKNQLRDISVYPLLVEGIGSDILIDKKIVIIKP